MLSPIAPQDRDPSHPQLLDFWGRAPGTVGSGVATAVVISAGLTLTVAVVTMWVFVREVVESPTTWQWIGYQLPGVALAAIATAMLWRASPLSRAVRLAAALPAAQLLIVAGAWSLWRISAAAEPALDKYLPFASSAPLEMLAPLGCLLVALAVMVAGWRRGHRRPIGWLRHLVVFSLLHLLLIGLWLPFATEWLPVVRWGCETPPNGTWCFSRHLSNSSNAVWIAGPPLLAAAVATLIRGVRPVVARSFTTSFLGATVILCVVVAGVFVRAYADHLTLLSYNNLLPWLGTSVLFALTAVVMLAYSHARSLRVLGAIAGCNNPDCQRGVAVALDDDDTALATVRVRGWLSGLETQSRSFGLRTRDNLLLIERGAQLRAAVPLWTTRGRRGDRGVLLKAGDDTIVTGFVSVPLDAPYRSATVPLPGPAGLVVWPQGEAKAIDPGQDLALLLWRPALALGVIAAVVAIPGLAALFAC